MNLDFTKPRYNPTAKLNPWQVTGLTDGEGGFFCSILTPPLGPSEGCEARKGKPRVKLEFKVTQKSHSAGILHELKEFFECGSVVIDNRETKTQKYHVTSLSNIIEKIIPHFDSYPCLTSKHLNFKDWKEIALIRSNKEQLSNFEQKLDKIREINSKMNKTRSFEDKYDFCKTSLGLNKENKVSYRLPDYWVQAFIDGEGTFYNYISEKKSRNTAYLGVDSSLEIAQNSHDAAILLAIKKFFDSGYLKPKYNVSDLSECKGSRSVTRFILRDTDKIIKFLEKYPLLTRKSLDFEDWKKIVDLKNTGAHKTPEGLKLMSEIKEKMNSKRDLLARDTGL